jgi:hypothetical protein
MRLAIALTFLLSACSFSPKVPQGGVVCGAGDACLGGLQCRLPERLCCDPMDPGCGGNLPVREDAGVDGPVGGDGDGGCKLVGTSSCPGGQSCHPFCVGGTMPTTHCEAVGTARRGERCARSTDCAAGLGCLFSACAAGGEVGVCKPSCNGDADCGPGARCLDVACGTISAALHICTTACDPRPGVPATCQAGFACALLAGETPDCRCPQGTVDEGAKCDGSNRCKNGLICTVETAGSACRPICRLDTPASCGAGRSCVPVAGYKIYGGCTGMGAPPAPESCDATQVGACSAGKACRLTCTGPGLGRTSCETGVGTKQAAETCTRDADCASSLTCISRSCPSGTSVSYCERMCKTDGDCGSVASACVAINCMMQTSPFRICGRGCDPVGATSGCPAGLTCALYPSDRTDCACRTGGPQGADGVACKGIADCAPGHLCVQRGTTSTCRPVCRTGGTDCAAGRTCAPLPDHKAYGACIPTEGDTPPPCDPALATSCTGGAGCFVSCTSGVASVSCQPAGIVEVGKACTRSTDCVPGADCLTTTCADASKRLFCVRHCRTNDDCGGGTARCLARVCGNTAVPYGSCTISCDPRGAATTGCPDGTVCTLYPGELSDCSCRGAAQKGADGEVCTSSLDCQPGLSCVVEAGRKICRPLCRLDAPTTCGMGRTCTPLSDQRIYGACTP